MIKNYDCELNYHPNKANVVTDALSRKSTIGLATTGITQRQLIMELERVKLEVNKDSLALLSSIVIRLELLKRIKIAQRDDLEC